MTVYERELLQVSTRMRFKTVFNKFSIMQEGFLLGETRVDLLHLLEDLRDDPGFRVGST